MCTASGANLDSFDVSGEFDDGDGTLKFTHLQSTGRSGQITATCTIAGVSITRSMAAPAVTGEDVAAGSDVRIALEDGAQLSLPIPPMSGVMSEITIELSCEDGGPAVAAAPDHQS